MKRILGLFLSFGLLGTSAVIAQTAAPAANSTATTTQQSSSTHTSTSKTYSHKQTTKPGAVVTRTRASGKPNFTPPVAGANTRTHSVSTPSGVSKSSTKLKADGTPDMRYKANKQTTKRHTTTSKTTM